MSCILGVQTVATVWDRALEAGRGRRIWNVFWIRTRKSYWQGFLVKKSQILFSCHNFGLINEVSFCCFVLFFTCQFRESINRFQVLLELAKTVCKIIECIYLYIYNFEGEVSSLAPSGNQRSVTQNKRRNYFIYKTLLVMSSRILESCTALGCGCHILCRHKESLLGAPG